ncbi:hypothetical protein [Actinoplanes subtropicus]|uniref:hypothetical protein n=1 Tax=Actinoplanes subtropicus TaxID=543632 RepID=UPI0004C42212|nr:hypothetical protein [Actinoplanes subtropicus]
MRGGLDDALDKLARRDELRRRAAGEATGTSPAVTELVEAIAGVVARHPELGVTVGAEGSGEPVLLHFFFAEGQVQVSADNPVQPEVPAARHADVVEIDLEPEPYSAPPSPAADPRRFSHDDQDRYGPASYGYAETPYYAESDTAERRYGSFDNPPADDRYPSPDPGETSRDLGARMRDLGMASRDPGFPAPSAPEYPPHPYAATPPPPVPPQTSRYQDPQATHRIRADRYHDPAENEATERLVTERLVTERLAPQPQRGDSMPSPLPKPIPLQVERPEETEMAARRLAALLRDDPSLLNNGHQG